MLKYFRFIRKKFSIIFGKVTKKESEKGFFFCMRYHKQFLLCKHNKFVFFLKLAVNSNKEVYNSNKFKKNS